MLQDLNSFLFMEGAEFLRRHMLEFGEKNLSGLISHRMNIKNDGMTSKRSTVYFFFRVRYKSRPFFFSFY